MASPEESLAFLFTDIEGSTARWEAHPDAMRDAVARHDQLMRGAIESNRGRVFKTVGDAFCAVFPAGADAIAAAISAQRALLQSDWSAVDGLRVRMAINCGPVEERGEDYFGQTLNRVARVLGVAYGGQVLLTAEAASDLKRLDDDASLRDLGSHRLKDLPEAQKIYQLLAKGLRVEFPPLRSVESHPTNIPRQLSSFLGRETELEELTSLIGNAHLVTITGAPGVGKTQTALQAAVRLHDRYADGAWLVDFGALASGDLVPGAIASVFSIEELSRDRPLIEDITFALKGKHVLIVFDNCEHVVTEVAHTGEHLLKNCPNLTIVATSREPLAISAERTFRLPTLPESTAIELFAERARAANSSFAITPANQSVVADIVRRLDGIPLAIELAASRVKILRVEQINAGLQQRFKLLTGGSRTALPRQQTLQALIGWSYDLLSDAERSMLRQLAIFRGGWTLPAVFDVCSDDRYPEWDAIALLESLAEKSLAVVDANENETRYRLLESTREYALARLHEDPEQAAVVTANHATFFFEESTRAFDSFWATNVYEWDSALRPDFGNFRAAIDTLLGDNGNVVDGVSLIANLTLAHTRLYEIDELLERASAVPASELPPLVYGRLQFARALRGGEQGNTYEHAKRAVELLGDSPNVVLRAEAQVRLAGALFRMGRVADAIAQCEPGLELARSSGLERLIAFALAQMALFVTVNGDARRGIALNEEAAQTLRALEDGGRLRSVLINMAEVQFAAGDAESALRSVDEALALALDAGGLEHSVMVCHINAAGYLLSLGRFEEASERARAAIEIGVRIKRGFVVAIAVGHIGEIAAAFGDFERAATLIGYVDAFYETRGIVREPTEAFVRDAAMRAIAAGLVEERRAALFAEGAQLSPEAAVRLAMGFTLPAAVT
jgi:predicted ATPase/class 3 adenylate cyclase